MRKPFIERQNLPYEYELLVKFDEKSVQIWALCQQAIHGDINVPSILLIFL